MANFFRDNADLRRRIASASWARILPALERDFTDPHELAPKSLEEAVEQIEMVLDMVGSLAAEEVAPHAAEVDRVGARLVNGRVVYPEPIQRAFRMLSEAGLMGFTLPREFGGMNLGVTAYTAAVEMIARADASLMTLFALQGCGETIHRFAPRPVQERYLPRLCTGEITPCMALTEPNAGSALGAVSTRATLLPDGTWRLNGSKCFITNGGADLLLVLARSEEGKPGGEGLSLFAVERGSGIEVGKLEDKLGIHGSATATVNLADVPGILLGRRGEGLYKVTLSLLHNVRLEVAAQAVGIAQAAQVASVRYANERQQFGRSIEQFAPVRAMLFDNATEIEAARAIVVTTASVVDRKRGLERAGGGEELQRYERLAELLTPLSKYYACEMVNSVTSRAIQIHGGYGYSREYPVERHFRDGRITSIYEGTSEIQVGAMIEPLLKGGLPLLFEEPLSDAPEPPCASGALGVLRANYEMMVQAAEAAARADRFAHQGWARQFADAVASILSGLVFLNDATKDERSAILAKRQAHEGRRLAETLLRVVREGDRAPFDDDSFGPVIGTYR
ncbi:MAG TPA: acyl-CoA dehydrogenase family protein [Planctomycetota bacterium]|nr:acyl-CoA dehydrogenase family protein [Planctomycetota bacterium]